MLTRTGSFLRDLGLPLPPRARIVFHPDYVSSLREAGARSAFDVRRSARIIEQLHRAGALSSKQVLGPQPVTKADLLLVHTEAYVEQICKPERLSELLFVPRGTLRENELLQVFLLQTGGTMLALEHALRHRVPVFNLGGGFHHAQRDRAEGFCPVNDIAIAVRRVQQLGLARRILVVDLDFHQGNGTSLIFSDDESVFTYSVHGQTWARLEQKENNLDIELPSRSRDELYLRSVRETLPGVFDRFRPDAVIYVAGADAAAGDALGDFSVSEDGLLERDLFVFETARAAGVPLVVVLGGGYGPFAWCIAYNFVYSVLSGRRIDEAYRPSNIEARYRRIKSRLDPAALRESEPELSNELLTGILEKGQGGGAFLNYYSLSGLKMALERYGLLDMLRELGFENLLISLDTADPERQVARIHFDAQDTDHLLIELVVRYRTLITPEEAVREGACETYRMLSIEWLTMQNPREEFTLSRRKLPGQRFPGLGVGRWMLELLRMMAERLDCAGVMSIPQHYHNAYLYSKQMLCFLPGDQGYLEAMKRDLGRLPLVETSIAIDEGRLRDARTGTIVSWEGKPQVMPTKPELNAYFVQRRYIELVSRARDEHHFELL